MIKNIDTGDVFFEKYDKLVISTGAEPVIPEFANIKSKNIYTLRTLDDGIKLKKGKKRAGQAKPPLFYWQGSSYPLPPYRKHPAHTN